MSRGPPFLADEMLGKLARDLRALGYDAAYARDVEDDELLARARETGRLLLTRDTRLADRAGEACHRVEARDPAVQLDRLADALDLTPDPEAFLTRCLACNAVLEETRAPDEVPDDVEDRPHWRCPGCERVYWLGSHATAMLDRLGHLLPETPPLLRDEGR